MNYYICLSRIIGDQMHCKVMGAFHAGMHHEDTGLNGSALTWFEDHRTDGQRGRSTSLHYFYIRRFFETQHAITLVSDLDGKRHGSP